ncbi:MAG: carbohydrate-binding domain-containing protein [Eubacteriales bacterium]|nr:carbohydrate-binding domain-containing protein [Eubacteriales bacterium]
MKKKWLSILCAALICASCAACSGEETTGSGTTSGTASDMTSGTTAAAIPGTAAVPSVSDVFTDRDYEVGYSDYVTVTLADGASAADGEGVRIDGGEVTITAEGTYLLTGTLQDGRVVVDADKQDKIQLVLSGASVTSASSAALYIRQADKVFVTLDTGTENRLESAGAYIQTDDNTVDAALFSKDDLTINGSGSLTVCSAEGHGIVSKDDLVITGGSFSVTAASHGLSAKDSLRIAGGSFEIDAGKDGLHCENKDDASLGSIYLAGGSFVVTAAQDGVDAAAWLTVDGGSYTFSTGGGSTNASLKADGTFNRSWGLTGGSSGDTVSAKGFKAAGDLTVSDGSFALDTSDDALHSNANLTVSGGTFTVASGDDGFHADAALTVSGGTILISKSYEGMEGASVTVNGGDITLTASDDGLNAAGGSDGSALGGRPGMGAFDTDVSAFISVSGGVLRINASGDGIDSNGSLTVSGGETYVSGPENSGNGALDYAGAGTITGGVFAAAGEAGMAMNFGGDSTQGAMLVTFDAAIPGGTEIVLRDADGGTLLAFTPEKTFRCAVLSAPGVVQGNTYTVTAGEVSVTVEMTATVVGGSGGMTGGKGFGGVFDRGGFSGEDGRSGKDSPKGGEMPGNGELPGNGEAPEDGGSPEKGVRPGNGELPEPPDGSDGTGAASPGVQV